MSDYISREAAIETIKNLYPSMPLVKLNVDKWHEKNKAYMECEIAIEAIPAADVRPVVRGKWEDVEVTYVADKTTLPFERISSMRCNQCNRYHTEIYYYGNPTEMAHFCPNCGADMRPTSMSGANGEES